MARHIGIVACSVEGAALCYRTIAIEGLETMGEHDHPEVTISSIPMARHMELIRRDDWAGVADLMLEAARKVAGRRRGLRDLPRQHPPSGPADGPPRLARAVALDRRSRRGRSAAARLPPRGGDGHALPDGGPRLSGARSSRSGSSGASPVRPTARRSTGRSSASSSTRSSPTRPARCSTGSWNPSPGRDATRPRSPARRSP